MKTILLAVLIAWSPVVFADGNVPIADEFSHKIVYAAYTDADQAPLKEDCRKRGGTFNECGSMCDDRIKDMTCTAVCVFTCQLDTKAIIIEDYEALRKECRGNKCCISSVKGMQQAGGFRIAKEISCPEGYQKNLLKCPESHQWCQPAKK